MAMAFTGIAGNIASSWGARTAGAVRRAAVWSASASTRNVRRTVILTVLLVCTCFAAATLLQMRRDYAHALSMAESYTQAQSAVLASETGRTLDRLAALGIAYTAAVDERSAQSMVQASDGTRIMNIALADADGRFIGAMKGQPLQALPLPLLVVERADVSPTVTGFGDPAIGSSPLTLVFKADKETPPRFVVMPLDPISLLPKKALGQTALFDMDGATLALGSDWENAPPSYALRADPGSSALRYVELEGAKRIIALSPVPGWPLMAAASVRASEALDTWYGSLPLYLFVILGPAIAGAILAIILVREFERADRARKALVAVKAIGEARAAVPAPSEADLLRRLSDSERRAKEAERAKGEFVAHMSHELRTPLNAIIGFAEIIQTGMFGPAGQQKYVEYAGDIGKAGRALHERLGDILEFAAADPDAVKLNLSPVDLNGLVSTALAGCRVSAMARDVAVEENLNEIPAVRADEAAIKRILTILLSNALRYTKEGGGIAVETRREEDTVVLAVRDTGAGLSADELSKIGQPFVRFTRQRKDGDDGSGLGLSVAMAMTLARRMGGALRLAGATGEGTWAELRLPVQ